MAGQVPSTPPPMFATQLGNALTAGSKIRGDAMGAQLDARAAALGSILGNIKGIAEVGGGNIAPDKLISQFAGGDVPIFTNDYAATADGLRLDDMRAGIGAKNRSGTGGKTGGGMTMDPTTFMVDVIDKNTGQVVGQQPMRDPGDIATLNRLNADSPFELKWTPNVNVTDTQVVTKGAGSAGTPVVTGGTPKGADQVISPPKTQTGGAVTGSGAEGPVTGEVEIIDGKVYFNGEEL